MDTRFVTLADMTQGCQVTHTAQWVGVALPALSGLCSLGFFRLASFASATFTLKEKEKHVFLLGSRRFLDQRSEQGRQQAVTVWEKQN